MSGTTNPGERGRLSAPRKAATISLAGTPARRVTQ